MSLNEEWKWDKYDHQIAGKVESEVDDQMVDLCSTLYLWCRRLPECLERPTPVAVVERHHYAVCYDTVDGSDLNNNSLSKVLGQAVIEHQQACFGAPLYGAHHALRDENAF